MPDTRFAPGFVTNSQANAIADAVSTTEANRRDIERLRQPGAGEISVSITSGSGGLHAWSELARDDDGSLYAKSPGLYGTAAYMPVRMIDGSTLTTFPVNAWIKPVIMSETLGQIYEVTQIAGSGGSGGSVTPTFSGAAVYSTIIRSPSFPANATFDGINYDVGGYWDAANNRFVIPATGYYLIGCTIQCYIAVGEIAYFDSHDGTNDEMRGGTIGSGIGAAMITASTVVYRTSGTYVYGRTYTSGAGTISNGTSYFPQFWIARVGI